MELPHPREMGAGRWLSGEGSSQVVCGEVVSLEVHLDVSDVSFWHLFIYGDLFSSHPASFPDPKCSKLPVRIPITTVARFKLILENQFL